MLGLERIEKYGSAVIRWPYSLALTPIVLSALQRKLLQMTLTISRLRDVAHLSPYTAGRWGLSR